MTIQFPHPLPLQLPLIARVAEGLDPAIDAVAARAVPSHGFLTRGWFAAAVEAYGGTPRTLIVEAGNVPALVLPWVGIGPAWLKLASVPGSYWPFRTFPVALEADTRVHDAALARLAREVRALRIGPVGDDDPAAMPLIAAARAAGWTVLDRFVATRWLLRLSGAEAWPRSSTLKKNRWHEKQMAAAGALDWQLEVEDWPAAFDTLAAVEAQSWQGAERDAKFTDTPHGRFWRAAARDPRVAGIMRAALLSIDGKPAAFSFDLETGAVVHALANSYVTDDAKHSPGKLLQYRNLVAQRNRGATLVDWGAGDSGYKATMGAVAGPALRDWLLIAPGPAELAARALRGWWRRSGNAEG
ncbi:MAG TPA: GNAT family N-acetyltransferase [Sphingomonas sp.]